MRASWSVQSMVRSLPSRSAMTISSPIGVAIRSIRKSSGSAMVGHPEMLRGVGVPRPPGRRRIESSEATASSRGPSRPARAGRAAWRSAAPAWDRARGGCRWWRCRRRGRTPACTRATMAGSARTSGKRMVTATALRSGRWATATVPRLAVELDAAVPHAVLDPFARSSARCASAVEHAGPVVGRPVGAAAASRRRRGRAGRRRSFARRSALGGRPNSLRKISLKRRTLPKPAASATSVIGRRVSWISCLANSTRRVCATAIGEAPRCCWNSRRSWRPPTPSRSASASTPASLRRARPRRSAPARATRCWRCRARAPSSGAVSGRQRRQGRKPASWAAAAEAKKRQFSNFGVRAGQIGRQ